MAKERKRWKCKVPNQGMVKLMGIPPTHPYLNQNGYGLSCAHVVGSRSVGGGWWAVGMRTMVTATGNGKIILVWWCMG